MSKVKLSEIPHYELLYIISNKYAEEELKPIVEKIDKIIADSGGKKTYSEEWGKKKLAYPIKHFNFGYYNLVEFDIDSDKMQKINRELRIFNPILRFQIVAKRIKKEAEIQKEKEISKKIATKAVKEEKIKEEKARGKVDLKELDKKLDKILETDDLL